MIAPAKERGRGWRGLENAKHQLPLPDLLNRLGLAQHAKKSAKCPFHDDRSNSFSVYRNRKGNWRWNCFAGCGGGDEPDFIAKLENLANPAACRRYMELAGTWGKADFGSPPRREGGAKESVSPGVLPEMPPTVADQWSDGFDYFFKNIDEVRHLAEARSWPIDFTMCVIERGFISMPSYNGQRGVAFQVLAPEIHNGVMTTKPIGYHIRIKPQDRDKPLWLYVPNKSQHGQPTPALPLLIGDFDSAKLLVITEGEWDAITLALAAGWLGEGCNWPGGVGVIGIRGASGVSTFLQFYRSFWPREVNCLVLADADTSGRSWYDGDGCFAAKLFQLCRKVAVVECRPTKDFNDLYRTVNVGPDEIRDLLARHGMPLGNEAVA